MEASVEKTRSRRTATKVGRVVSDAMNKSIVVEVERHVEHGRYKRTVKRTSRFMAHDESNSAKTGDRVLIQETRPMSRRKRWILREVIVKAKA
jgi:small subunit ribosomal protein S17